MKSGQVTFTLHSDMCSVNVTCPHFIDYGPSQILFFLDFFFFVVVYIMG